MSQAIDTRTRIYCNRGPVISGNLEENTIVGAGLVNVTGSVVLDGVFRIKEGDSIELAYYKNGYLARLGRKLRAVSVYANPVTRTTEVALGCYLTYQKDTEPPPKVISSLDDEDGLDLTPVERLTLLEPIRASFIAQTICDEIGLAHDPFPLQNTFYTEEFEISGPYLNVLSDLLISENYVGYIDSQERLKFVNLGDNGGTGPVLDESKIIDIQPINSGDPAASRVYSIVNHTRVTLPDEDEGGGSLQWIPREIRTSYDDRGYAEKEFRYYPLKYSDLRGFVPDTSAEPIEETIRYRDITETETFYGAYLNDVKVNVANIDPDDPSASGIEYRVEKTVSTTQGPWGDTIEQAEYEYSSKVSEGSTVKVITETKTIAEPSPVITEACGYPPEVLNPSPSEIWKISGTVRWGFGQRNKTAVTSATRTITEEYAEYTISRSYTQVARVNTTEGSVNVQQLIDSYNKPQWIGAFPMPFLSIFTYASELVPGPSNVSYNEAAPSLTAPRPDELNAYQITEEPEIIYTQDSGSGINLELTPPFVPDDRVVRDGDGFVVIPSDAVDKAKNFARIQNKLRKGYRNGQSIVYPIEYVPIRPFSPLYLSFGGVVGQFRSDRTNIVFDSSGILVSTDAIFWGGVGQ